MFQGFEKKLKKFLVKKNVTQYSYNQNLILLLRNLPQTLACLKIFLSIIELLHPSLNNSFDNLNGYMLRVAPS